MKMLLLRRRRYRRTTRLKNFSKGGIDERKLKFLCTNGLKEEIRMPKIFLHSVDFPRGVTYTKLDLIILVRIVRNISGLLVPMLK